MTKRSWSDWDPPMPMIPRTPRVRSELEALAKGYDPRSRVAPPKPGERCPRCHRYRATGPIGCALCNPDAVPIAVAVQFDHPIRIFRPTVGEVLEEILDLQVYAEAAGLSYSVDVDNRFDE